MPSDVVIVGGGSAGCTLATAETVSKRMNSRAACSAEPYNIRKLWAEIVDAHSKGAEPMMADAVVFDFDYTLADSSNGIVKCIQYALAHLGLAPAPESRMRESIGLTLAATLTYLTGIVDAKIAAEFTRTFVQHADEIMADHTFFYDAAPAVLAELRSAGVPLGIVSTKYRYRIESILQREALLPHFDIIVGGEDVEQHKPHPSSLERALVHLGCAPAQALYVGDHPVDAEAAHRAGVPFVAVLTGMSKRDHFTSFPYLALLDDLSALLPILRRR